MKKAYKNRYNTAKNIAIGAVLVAIIGVGVSISFYQTMRGLRQSQNLMLWEMDESCFKQIQNSSDGVIRLQIK